MSDVKPRKPTKGKHPAPYSKEIIVEMRRLLLERWPAEQFFGRPMLFDPFGGEGVGLAKIAGGEFNYAGVEIEASLIRDPRIAHGDATDPAVYPACPFVIVTSPVYPNGVADHAAFELGSQRYTYRTSVAVIEGQDRELHESNMARFGYRGTKRLEEGGSSIKRKMYWVLAERSVQCWWSAEMLFVNVSDFMHSKGVVEPLVEDWKALLRAYGWVIDDEVRVRTRRNRNGANRDLRVDGEVILVAVR